jgi:hypothetical protein
MSILHPDERLDALTDEVVVSGPISDVFHAPNGESNTSLCGVRNCTRYDLQHAPLRSTPCGHCFSPEVVENYDENAQRRNGSDPSPP